MRRKLLGSLVAAATVTAGLASGPTAEAIDENGTFTSYYPEGGAWDQGALAAFDAWQGFQSPVVGDFFTLNPDARFDLVTWELNDYWDYGAITFANLETSVWNTQQLADGVADGQLAAFANAVADWYDETNDQGKIFIAYLQEANGYWTSYGCTRGDPVGSAQRFVAAYRHGLGVMESVFASRGVPDGAVAWTWAPNGWADPGCGSLSLWYPGDDVVEVAALSAYNFGSGVISETGYPSAWENFDQSVGQYLNALSSAAPCKPQIIAQTASAEAGGNRDAWINDFYSRIQGFDDVRGVVWFNFQDWGVNVDWRVWTPAGPRSAAYPSAVQAVPGHGQQPLDLFQEQPADEGFCDVPPSHPYYDAISALAAEGVTSGCTLKTYCPAAVVTRGQMAIFVNRSMNVAVPADTVNPFTDVDEHAFYRDDVAVFSQLGITAGCGFKVYCPEAPVSRWQMAIFLARAMGLNIDAPSPAAASFGDVPPGHVAYNAIEALVDTGVTAGCGGGNFCPDSSVTRGEMAVFLFRAFGAIW